MKKFLFILALLVTTSCYAEEKVTITNPDGTMQKLRGDHIQTTQVNVGTTPISLGATSPITSIAISNNPNNISNSIYIGGSSVTAGNGIFLSSGSILKLDINSVNGIYAISQQDNQWVTVLTQY